MTVTALAVVAGLYPTPAAVAQSAGWRVERVQLSAPAAGLRRNADGTLAIEAPRGAFRRMGLKDERIILTVAEAPPGPAHYEGMLPDGRVARLGAAAAWFAGPTSRYGHGILGDGIEAESLAVRAGALLRVHTLGADAVFEDLEPRFADTDGDGIPEILAIKAYIDRGAALAAFAIGPDRLRPLAETPPIGLPHRWLNPVGVADFDGDGRPEIALVATPHIGGILRFYRMENGRFRLLAERRGYSNHAIGSRVLDQAAVGDFDGDGIADIALPDQSRQSLRFVHFSARGVREFANVALGRTIDGEIYAADLDGDGAPEIVLRSGARIYLVLRR